MDTLNDIISGLKWGNLDPIEAHERILALFNVAGQSEQTTNKCTVCGSADITEAPHMGRNCNTCNPI